MAAVTLSEGQRMIGKTSCYKILGQLQKNMDVWTAVDDHAQKVVVKRAPQHLLENERKVLESVGDHSCIRPMIDDIDDPPSLVLRYLDDHLLRVAGERRLESPDVKAVARNILKAIAALHDKGFVHTDIKPDNILVNYGKDGARFSQIQLGDCGDAYRFNPDADPLEEGHNIGALIFRSPEATLNLRWGPPTDIWSLGATLISLIFGEHWHIFSPAGAEFDEKIAFWVLVEHVRRFGPVQLSYKEIAGPDQLGILAKVINHVKDNQSQLPWAMSVDKELATEDRDFIAKMMKLDPRDRPTAKQLLDDEWFQGCS